MKTPLREMVKKVGGQRNPLNPVGLRFSNFLVIGEGECDKHRARRWKCICNCGNKVTVLAKNLKRGSSKSCGCIPRNFHGEKSPRWKGGITSDVDGRILIYSPNHPCKRRGNNVLRSRLVVESHIGRYLLPNEIVHHINEIKTDDRIENLKIMSPSQHARLHFSLHGKWAKLYDNCKDCGTKEIKHDAYGRCEKCRGIFRFRKTI